MSFAEIASIAFVFVIDVGSAKKKTRWVKKKAEEKDGDRRRSANGEVRRGDRGDKVCVEALYRGAHLTNPGLELGARVGLDDVWRNNANVQAHDQAQRERFALLLSVGSKRKKERKGEYVWRVLQPKSHGCCWHDVSRAIIPMHA